MARKMNPEILRGAAALQEALNTIGDIDNISANMGDHRIAKIICDGELSLRSLLRFVLEKSIDELF